MRVINLDYLNEVIKNVAVFVGTKCDFLTNVDDFFIGEKS